MKRLLLLSSLVLMGSIHAAAPKARFRAVNVDTNITVGYGIAVADVDGDKQPDIILCDSSQIAWYRNPGWTKFVIAEKLTPIDHVCVAAADIDGDGKAEIAVGAGWNPSDTVNSGAVFYLVPPADRTQRWQPVKLPHEPTVHRMRWVRDGQGNSSLVVVPLHGRGNKDGQGAGVKIQRYTPPPNIRDPWKVEDLNDTLHKTHKIDPVQWDDDPSQELLVASREGAFLLNWAPDERKLQLTQLGSDEHGGLGEIRLGHLKEGRLFLAGISPMHGNQLVIFRRSNNPTDKLWQRQVLDESLVDGHAVACGDLLGMGSDQIVAGWRAMNQPTPVKVGIKLFIPDDAEGKSWQSVLVDDNTMACEDVCLADLNGDRKLDIIASGRATRNVKVYLNEN
jgi:hypothetical protein